jgi:hypothetical protein
MSFGMDGRQASIDTNPEAVQISVSSDKACYNLEKMYLFFIRSIKLNS